MSVVGYESDVCVLATFRSLEVSGETANFKSHEANRPTCGS